MTVELITGYAGTPHIGSDDIGAFQAGIVGPGDYALATGNQLKATMSNANTIAVQSGDAVLNGRHVHLTGTTTATGTRHICHEYHNNDQQYYNKHDCRQPCPDVALTTDIMQLQADISVSFAHDNLLHLIDIRHIEFFFFVCLTIRDVYRSCRYLLILIDLNGAYQILGYFCLKIDDRITGICL